MNPLPSSSRCTNLQHHNTRKFVGNKTYVPHLFVSRLPEVKVEANEEVEKNANFSGTGRRYWYFQKRKLLRGTETFAAHLNTVNSDITIQDRPKTADSTSNSYLDIIRAEKYGEESSNEGLVTKSNISKFARVSSASLSDLPISIPRPRLSSFNDTNELASLLSEYCDSPVEKSVKFILTTPQFLPMMCTIHELPDGQIGTLQIMKSNRLRLVLGECKLWLYRGVKVDFREEVVYVNLDGETETGEIVNLGDIRERILAVPECVTAFANDYSRGEFNDNFT